MASSLESPSPVASSPSPVMACQCNLLPRGVHISPPPSPARDASSSSRFAIPVVNQPRCHTPPRPRCHTPPPSFVAPTTSVSLLHAFATLTVFDGRAPVPRLRRPYATLPLAPHRAAQIYHLRLGGYYSTVVRGLVHGGHQIQEHISDHLCLWSCRAAPHSSGSAPRTSTPSTSYERGSSRMMARGRPCGRSNTSSAPRRPLKFWENLIWHLWLE